MLRAQNLAFSPTRFHEDPKLDKAQALVRQLVDSRSRRSAGDTSAVNAHLSVAEIVHQDEDEVGFARLWLGVCCEAELSEQRGKSSTAR